MTEAIASPRALREQPDYTSRAYWNGTIKMSLSKFFILCVLADREMHGYDIARAVERLTNGCCSPSEGAMYPVLRDFEAGGYLAATVETVRGRERRVYRLTERGREACRVAGEAWMDITGALAAGFALLGADAPKSDSDPDSDPAPCCG